MGEVTATKAREPRLHLWTKDEYYKMASVGLFDGKQIELIEGKVLEMSPMGSLHATGVRLVQEALRCAFALGYDVRPQLPLNLSETSEPEPDSVVVVGHPRDYVEAHPKEAVLIVEVAETSLDYDRTEKGSLYASHGVADYWIFNLVDSQLEVYRDPTPDPEQPFGLRYRTRQVFKKGDTVSPLAAPQASITITDLLPVLSP